MARFWLKAGRLIVQSGGPWPRIMSFLPCFWLRQISSSEMDGRIFRLLKAGRKSKCKIKDSVGCHFTTGIFSGVYWDLKLELPERTIL